MSIIASTMEPGQLPASRLDDELFWLDHLAWLDDDLVRAEFDAIIAAEFPLTTEPARSADTARRPSGPPPKRRSFGTLRKPTAQLEGARKPGRERSPPRPPAPPSGSWRSRATKEVCIEPP